VRKIIYTKKLHAYRLTLMLNRPGVCSTCPAVPLKYKQSGYYVNDGYKNPEEVHSICAEFVGINPNNVISRCPCHVLGPDEAIRRTIEALKTYYSKEL
jgi:hypothetical protein